MLNIYIYVYLFDFYYNHVLASIIFHIYKGLDYKWHHNL